MNALLEIRKKIAEAALLSGRQPEEIQLVAVTKGIQWKEAEFLYRAGQRDFGENRLQEALFKKTLAPADSFWHFIGTLQRNKVSKAVGNFALIHSIDTFELAAKVSQCSEERGIVTPVLLQANTSGEGSKHGLSPEKWKRCFERVLQLSGIVVKGLMTIAPNTSEEAVIRRCFAALRALKEELSERGGGLQHLSMGMSQDFPWAIAEGATIVRIGSALFR